MRQLTIHLVGNGALLKHHHYMPWALRQRRNVKIDNMFAGIARGRQVDPVFVDRTASLPDLVYKRKQRRAERDEFAQLMTFQHRRRGLKEAFGRDIGIDDLAVCCDDEDGKWQRIYDRLGSLRDRGCGIQLHAAALWVSSELRAFVALSSESALNVSRRAARVCAGDSAVRT